VLLHRSGELRFRVERAEGGLLPWMDSVAWHPHRDVIAGGYVVGLVGVRPTLVLIAVLYTGVILVAYLRGHLRELDDRPDRD
jgi:hypothetical protein